jgi:RHS repeat-associated protein
MTDATGTFTYAYDDNDLLTGTQTSYSAFSAAAHPNLAVNYGYWPDASRETLSYGNYTLASPGTPTSTFTYNYDGDGRWTGLADSAGPSATWAYQNNGWLSSQALSASGTAVASTSYFSDQRGYTTSLHNWNGIGNVELSNFGAGSRGVYMKHDGLGNVLNMYVNLSTSTLYSGTTNYTYDTISGIGTRSQLTQESTTRNGGVTNNFAYDGGSYTASTGVGNPTTFRSTTLSGTYNADNQYSGNTYDGEGNPTSYSGYAMVFDPENHLTSFTQSGTTHSYTYNGDDQCVSTFQTGATAPTYSVYDGDHPFLQLASDGSVASVSDFGANGLFAKDGHFYLWDPSGNACQRLTSTGTVEYTRYVDAFGAVTNTDSITDSYGGMGGQWGYVMEGPFYRLGHRFYDPATGRFITRDPIGYDGGINLYGYVGNNPVDNIDPSGLEDVGEPDDPWANPVEPAPPFDYLQGGGYIDPKREYLDKDGIVKPLPKPGPYDDLPEPRSVGPNKNVTAAQARRIIERNKQLNNGEVRSDCPNDPNANRPLIKPEKSKSGVSPAQHEWQLDHIQAKSKGGSNSNTNIQVVSRQYNRMKSDK